MIEAVSELHQQLRPLYGEIFNVSFDHQDASGYWFTFELIGDPRRQTWCVRYGDLEGVQN